MDLEKQKIARVRTDQKIMTDIRQGSSKKKN
jgi:hypothetical protein